MAYKFGPDEPVAEAIVRCAREQLDGAIEELREGTRQDPIKAVHEARKAIKKERSLLRFARPAMKPKTRKRVNAELREVARSLSGARDAAVMVQALDTLSERYSGQLPATTFDPIRQHLDSSSARTNGSPRDKSLAAKAAEELGTIRLGVDDWVLRVGGWKAIERGLLRSFKRGRKAFRRVRRSHSAEAWHEWRKRVKDLWYQERLLAPTCGPTVRGQAKEAHRLADLLGDDHDLVVLREALTHGAMSVPADVDAVVNLLDHRRAELQAQALHTGARIYSESPKAFRRRMQRTWTAGRALARTPVERDPAALAAATREPHAA